MSVRPVPRPPAMSAVLRQRKWRSGGPPPKSGGPPQFGGPRTAATLALLLVLSLCANFALMFYHDEVVLGLHSLEEAHMELGDAPDWSEGSMHIDMGTEEDWSRGARSHYSMEPREILKRAGVDPDAGYVPSLTVSQANAAASKRGPDFKQAARLPPLADIQAMYGNRTRILGLEQCAAFRAAIPPADRVMGPAGIFNSATNLLNKLLQLNCVNEARVKAHKGKLRATGMMLQAPWGKHNPVPWRLHHEAVQVRTPGGTTHCTSVLVSRSHRPPVVAATGRQARAAPGGLPAHCHDQGSHHVDVEHVPAPLRGALAPQ